MTDRRFLWLIAGMMVVVVGCGSTMLTQENYGDFDYTLVETDTAYSLAMPEFYKLLASTDRVAEGGVVDTGTARWFLDSIVCDTLVGFEALSVEIENYERARRLLQKQYGEYLVRLFMDVTLYRPVTPDSTEVDSFYYARPDLFGMEEQVYVYHISIVEQGMLAGHDSAHYRSLSEEELARETRDYIYKIRDLVDSAEAFWDVARVYSQDTFRLDKSGSLGWVYRGTYLEPFDSIAFSLDSGEVSQPYRDKDGWHILWCRTRHDEGIPPLDTLFYESAFNTLRTIRANEKGRTIIAPLREDIGLELNQDILNEDVYGLLGDEWVAVVDQEDTIYVYMLHNLERGYRKEFGVESSTPQMKEDMIRRLADAIVIQQEARHTGLDTLPEARETWQRLFLSHARNIVIQDWFTSGWMPTDSAVNVYYEAHIDEFTNERPLTVQHIIVEDSIFGEFLRDQAMSGIDFLNLAEEHYPGDKSLRRNLADLGEIGPGDMPDVFYKAAQQTHLGEVSHPVKTEHGYHIIKLLARNDSIDEIQARHIIVPALAKRHAAEKFRQFKDRVYAKYGVRFPGELSPIHLKPWAERQNLQ